MVPPGRAAVAASGCLSACRQGRESLDGCRCLYLSLGERPADPLCRGPLQGLGHRRSTRWDDLVLSPGTWETGWPVPIGTRRITLLRSIRRDRGFGDRGARSGWRGKPLGGG